MGIDLLKHFELHPQGLPKKFAPQNLLNRISPNYVCKLLGQRAWLITYFLIALADSKFHPNKWCDFECTITEMMQAL